MSAELRFDPIRLPAECEALRQEVRAFLAQEIAAGTFDPDRPGHGVSHDPDFSRRVGAKGWIGMTWPKKYGGRERSFLERYVVTEEFRVANAPVRLYFVADRQSGPILLKYAPEHVKMDILPRICRGELCFVIGMSEPNSGSDLFAAKAKATKVAGAWKQATSELAYERSGPERFLETFYVLIELIRALGEQPDVRSAEGLGRLVAQAHTLRRMSVSVAGMLQAGKEPVVEGSLVKDLGTIWEQKLPGRVRELAAFLAPETSNRATLEEQLAFATKVAPKLTIQGGTTEILRGIIARGL